MTNTEITSILRKFNEWRRGDEDIPQFDPREIGEAIDAAIAMIDRLEAAESDALEQARLNGMGASREAALMAKLEAAEKGRDALSAELSKQQALTGAAQHIAEVAQSRANQLQARIEAMERQEPIGEMREISHLNWELCWFRSVPFGAKLFTSPGAKGE